MFTVQAAQLKENEKVFTPCCSLVQTVSPVVHAMTLFDPSPQHHFL